MTDLLTASAIATLAFQKFIESGAGGLAKKFTSSAIYKMDELRRRIVDRLKGKNDKLDAALVGAEQGKAEAISTVAKYLEMAMKDQVFAQEVSGLAREIQQDIDIQQGSGGEVWNVIGKAEKNEFTDNKAPIIKDNTGTININYGQPPASSHD